MKRAIPLNDNIYWIGVNDRESHLFESHWPLPQGITYNSYIIKDNQIALIDTVKAPYQTEYLEKIKNLIGEAQIDYLIINHMEPDHSGAISMIRDMYPGIQVVGNVNTKEFLAGFYHVDEPFITIEDGDELDLGTTKLKFLIAPMIHWPETMITYDETSGVFFTGDAFGGFGTLDGGIFDDELEMNFYREEILRYFSNIVGKYSFAVQKAIKKLKGLKIKTVAPTHGPIWRSDPSRIIKAYNRWSKFKTQKGVIIVYGSMYGNTKRMAEEIARTLSENGIEKVIVHDISKTNVSYIIKDIWKFKGLILGSCTYNTKIFPPMGNLIQFLENIKFKNHVLGLFGNYSWSGGALRQLQKFAEAGKWEIVEPSFEAKHSPTGKDFRQCVALAKNMVKSLDKEKEESPQIQNEAD